MAPALPASPAAPLASSPPDFLAGTPVGKDSDTARIDVGAPFNDDGGAVDSGAMWLLADYLPEVAALDRRIFPRVEQLARWLGGDTRTETIPVPRDTPDWTLMSFWAHPERVLDAAARQATSGFARMSAAIVSRVVEAVARDLDSGAWDRKHGALRALDGFDAGLRLVISV